MTEDLSGDSIAKTAHNINDSGGGGGGYGGGCAGCSELEVNKCSSTGDASDFEKTTNKIKDPKPLTNSITKPTITITTTTTTKTAATIMKNSNNQQTTNNNNKNKNNTHKNNDVVDENLKIMSSPPTPPAPPSIFLCNNPANCVTLKNILESLKNPIVEEQAWALIYQFTALYRNMVVSGVRQVFAENEIPTSIEQLCMHHDGCVHCSWADNMRKSMSHRDLQQESHKQQQQQQQQQQRQRQFRKDMERLKGPYSHAEVIASHEKVLHKIALIVYTALDFNLPQYEQCNISQELEDLITHMTSDDREIYETNEINDDDDENNIDEGIDDETTDEPMNEKCDSDTKVFDYVLEVCRNHIKPTVPEGHYRAVCRALVTETNELRIFLQHVLTNGTNTLHDKLNSDASKQELANLGFVDWARFWVQVIDELRRGVRLKKANYERAPIEYELTPYEILMEDIRSKKYQLKKVMVNGDIPPRVKKDAHAVILEFIRSRPPLKKASERKLPPPVKLAPSPRELLLDSIRKGQQLKHIPPPSPRLKDRLLPPTGQSTSTSTSSTATAEAISLPNLSVANNSCSNAAATTSNDATKASIAEALLVAQNPTSAKDDAADDADAANSARTTPRTKQRLIKVPISLLQDEDNFFDTFDPPTNVACVNPICSQPKMPPYPIGGYMATSKAPAPKKPAAPTSQMHSVMTRRELQGTTYDLATQCESRRTSLRRHTIVGCQSNLDETHSMPPSRPESRLADMKNANDECRTLKHEHNKYNKLQQQQQQQLQLQLQLKRSQSPLRNIADGDNSRRESTSNTAATASTGPWNKSFLDEKTWHERGDDRLSLTLEEIVHIRSVNTKAYLEGLPVGIGVKEDVEKRKICFLCLRTRFSIFGPWGIQCKLCERTVCSKCYTKMRLPSDHLRKLPLVLISPSFLSSPAGSSTPSPSHHASQHAVHADHIVDETFPKKLFERLLRSETNRNTVGSAPSSPKNQRSNMSTPGGIMTSSASAATGQTAIEVLHDRASMASHASAYAANGGHYINNKHINLMSRSMEGPQSLPANSPARPHSNCSTLDRRSKISRAFALSSSGSQLAHDRKENLRGELVAVCYDCKGLVMEITNSSKQTRSTARNRALQNLTLDLSPVYK